MSNSPLSTPNSPLTLGRPRSLDETKRAEICALVSNGCGLAGAARYVGSSVSTIRREARRNPEFAEKLRLAERKSELTPLYAIRRAARKSWRAGAYLMERADSERQAAKHARRNTIAQLKKYNASLIQILKLELGKTTLRNRLERKFTDVFDHCVHKIAAGRDPFPIPHEFTRVDSCLPAPPPSFTQSAPQPAIRETPAAPSAAKRSIQFGPPSSHGISDPINWPLLPDTPSNDPAP